MAHIFCLTFRLLRFSATCIFFQLSLTTFACSVLIWLALTTTCVLSVLPCRGGWRRVWVTHTMEHPYEPGKLVKAYWKEWFFSVGPSRCRDKVDSLVGIDDLWSCSSSKVADTHFTVSAWRGSNDAWYSSSCASKSKGGGQSKHTCLASRWPMCDNLGQFI